MIIAATPQVNRRVRRLRRFAGIFTQSRGIRTDDESAAAAHARYRGRSVTVRYEPDGAMFLQARLPAEGGALVMKALEFATERACAERKGIDAAEDDVSAETTRRLACDGSRIVLTEDEAGEPLSIGRKTRAFPPAIRRALQVRDKQCRFPGCTNTRVDAHHVVHWADGGETSLDNLLLLCRHHHRLLHEGGFSCERPPDGKIMFRDPGGRDLKPPGERVL